MGRYALDATLLDAYNETCDFYFQEEEIEPQEHDRKKDQKDRADEQKHFVRVDKRDDARERTKSRSDKTVNNVGTKRDVPRASAALPNPPAHEQPKPTRSWISGDSVDTRVYGSVTPMPWQRDFVKWAMDLFLTKQKRGAICADDMGLGKTLQSAMMIAEMMLRTTTKLSQMKVLIIAPSATIDQWAQEYRRVFPSESIYKCYGSRRVLDEIRAIPESARFVITTYDYVNISYNNMGPTAKRALVKLKMVRDLLRINGTDEDYKDWVRYGMPKHTHSEGMTSDQFHALPDTSKLSMYIRWLHKVLAQREAVWAQYARTVSKLHRTMWSYIIADEAHALRNGIHLDGSRLRSKGFAYNPPPVVKWSSVDIDWNGVSKAYVPPVHQDPMKTANIRRAMTQYAKAAEAPYEYSIRGGSNLIRFEAACMLDAQYRLALTGTPLQNRVTDYTSLCVFLHIPEYNDVRQWGRNLGTATEEQIRNSVWLQQWRQMYLIRRNNTLLNLPSLKIRRRMLALCDFEHDMLAGLNNEMLKLAELKASGSKKHNREGNQQAERARMQILGLIQKMQIVCNSPKCKLLSIYKTTVGSFPPSSRHDAHGRTLLPDFDHVLSLLKSRGVDTHEYEFWLGVVKKMPSASTKVRAIIEQLYVSLFGTKPCEKIVIFTEFESMHYILMDAISRYLPQYTGEIPRLSGSVKGHKRAEVLDRFRKIPTNRIMLLTTGVASEGINLVEANHAIFVEPTWNPLGEEQARRRIYRMLQKNSVRMFCIAARGTVEDWILSMQANKRHMADAVLKDGTAVKDFGGGSVSGEGKSLNSRRTDPAAIKAFFSKVVYNKQHVSHASIERRNTKKRERREARESKWAAMPHEEALRAREKYQKRRGRRSNAERTNNESSDEFEAPIGPGQASSGEDDDESPDAPMTTTTTTIEIGCDEEDEDEDEHGKKLLEKGPQQKKKQGDPMNQVPAGLKLRELKKRDDMIVDSESESASSNSIIDLIGDTKPRGRPVFAKRPPYPSAPPAQKRPPPTNPALYMNNPLRPKRPRVSLAKLPVDLYKQKLRAEVIELRRKDGLLSTTPNETHFMNTITHELAVKNQPATSIAAFHITAFLNGPRGAEMRKAEALLPSRCSMYADQCIGIISDKNYEFLTSDRGYAYAQIHNAASAKTARDDMARRREEAKLRQQQKHYTFVNQTPNVQKSAQSYPLGSFQNPHPHVPPAPRAPRPMFNLRPSHTNMNNTASGPGRRQNQAKGFRPTKFIPSKFTPSQFKPHHRK